MAFTEASSNGTLNSTTPVTIVAAPAASTRRLTRNLIVYNADTASVTLTLSEVHGANTRVFKRIVITTLDTFVWTEPLILDGTTKSITAVLAGAVTANQPDWITNYADVT